MRKRVVIADTTRLRVVLPTCGWPSFTKLGAAGTRNSKWTLILRLRRFGPLDVKRRFLVLRTRHLRCRDTRVSRSLSLKLVVVDQ